MSKAKKSKDSQHTKFKDLARRIGTDESEERFAKTLRNMARGKVDQNKPTKKPSPDDRD